MGLGTVLELLLDWSLIEINDINSFSVCYIFTSYIPKMNEMWTKIVTVDDNN